MAKKTAILLSSQDFLIETMLKSHEQTGMYIKILCLQSFHGPLSEEDIFIACGCNDDTVLSMLNKNSSGLYYKDDLDVRIVGSENKRQSEVDNRLYYRWRLSVMARDKYKCQNCGYGGDTSNPLHAHHIKRWADCVSTRYNVDNGITLCKICHRKIHSKSKEVINGSHKDV